MKTASGRKIYNGGNRIVPYAAYNIRMNSIVILGFMLSLFSLVATETFFPGKLIVLNYVFFLINFKGGGSFVTFLYQSVR